MDYKSMEYLVSIHEEKSLTKAAKKLFVSQPALSYRISQIEEELDVQIIKTDGRMIHFTEEGEYLVDWSKKELNHFQNMKEFISNMKGNSSKKIHIGVVNNFARYKLSPIIEEFKNLHPDIEVKLSIGSSSEVLSLLKTRKVNVAITRGLNDWNGERKILSQERISIISKEPIDIGKLPYIPRVSHTLKKVSKSSLSNQISLTDQIKNWWNENFDVAPLVGMEVDDIDTCKEMVKCSAGYSIIPRICLRDDDKFFTIDLTTKDGEPIIRNTWLLYNNVDEKSSVINFIDFLNL
ncbi:LysR family transcriptional regulator [Romboutsia weinsteinii]|uniref:LysR family transcriptional regulator n=1 Tax=Romboutsia weinsteinii TaxID=2020949 RepID=A0A371IXL7_9FIRM|nr:LysR family transcriptional regulator [Romboutsia weinsteinii]RDY25211.1 LysR family transcriptional regulator [Romboutsia weinsteinii]